MDLKPRGMGQPVAAPPAPCPARTRDGAGGSKKQRAPSRRGRGVPFAPAAAGSAGGDAGKAKRRPDGRVWGRSGRGQGRCDGVVGGRPEPPGSPEVSARQEGAPGSRGQRLVRAETGPPWALIAGSGAEKAPSPMPMSRNDALSREPADALAEREPGARRWPDRLHLCVGCGAGFYPARIDTIHCSSACRQRAVRRRRAARKAAARVTADLVASLIGYRPGQGGPGAGVWPPAGAR
jgi:hypothetical protein